MSHIMAHATPSPRALAQYAPYLLTLASLGSLLVLGGCSSGAGAQPAALPDRAIPVRVTTLRDSAAASPGTLTVTGTLAGKEEVSLAFKIGGVIGRIAVDPGQRVRAGQVLATLRPTEIASQVASAQEGRRKAERDLARVTQLYADSVATLEQLQDARTALALASNSVRIAEFNADYAVIRAPGDGMVLTRSGEPGQVVEAGRPVLQVRRDARGLVVRVGLPDRDALRVRLGDMADVQFEAIAGRRFSGRVTQRAAAVSQGTGDYAVEVTLRDAEDLPTGLVAQVTLRPAVTRSTAAARVLVPIDALVDADADSAAVFVLRAGGTSVSRRVVKLTDVAEALQTAQVPVASGLDGSESVVIAGVSRLVDGATVRVVTTAATRTAAGAAPQWKAAP
jgi:multidrug efflux system membrane fusion protein